MRVAAARNFPGPCTSSSTGDVDEDDDDDADGGDGEVTKWRNWCRIMRCRNYAVVLTATG